MSKEYENIYAKMLLQHNEEIVPFLKEIGSRSINIKWQRQNRALERLEEGKNQYIQVNFLHEYLLMNKFIVQLLDVEEYKNCLDLVNNCLTNK